MKFNIKDIIEDLNDIDTGFCFIGRQNNKYIELDNDENGNGNDVWLRLELKKDCLKIKQGSLLTQAEKKIIWPFCNYNNLNNYNDLHNLTDDVAAFTIKFVKSFKRKLIRKLK